MACLKAVTPATHYLKCCECGNCYHIGKCSGITKNTLKSMSRDELLEWSCSTCVSSKSRLNRRHDDSDSQAGASEPSLHDVMSKLDLVLRRLDVLEKKQEEQVVMHDATNRKIDKQTETIEGIEKTLEFLSSKYDNLLTTVEAQKEELKDLKEKTTHLEADLLAKDERVSDLEIQVDRLEHYSRKKNLEIHGIAYAEGEDLRVVLSSVANKLKLRAPNHEDIEVVHRVKAKAGMIPPILVRFSRQEMKEDWLKKRTSLKEEGIYLNENMTFRIKKLLWETKKVAKDKEYEFAWARNGRVFVKKHEGAKPVEIRKISELNKIA